jgi:hypothetical protein
MRQMQPPRGRVHGGPHVPGVARGSAVVQGQHDNLDIANAKRQLDERPLRPGEGQEAHHRVPRRAQAQERHEGSHPVHGGPARRGQDLAGPLHRRPPGPQVPAHLAGRRARRGRDPRPPAHLRGRLPGRIIRASRRPAPTTRCSCSTRSTSSATTSAATRRRPRCWRCSTRSRTTPSPTTTWTCPSTCPRCSSSPRPTSSTHAPALRDRMESHRAARLHAGREAQIARRHLIPKAAREHGITPDQHQELDGQGAAKGPSSSYTREAGVRNLEREIAGWPRCAAGRGEGGQGRRARRSPSKKRRLKDVPGPEKFYNEVAERTEVPGVATGLAWTAARR